MKVSFDIRYAETKMISSTRDQNCRIVRSKAEVQRLQRDDVRFPLANTGLDQQDLPYVIVSNRPMFDQSYYHVLLTNDRVRCAQITDNGSTAPRPQ